MAVVYQHDKRSGLTYAYESQSYWDGEGKRRVKRKLIGRVDSKTGEIVPTDGRNRKDKPKAEKAKGVDYQKLYEKLEKKCAAQEALIAALKKQIAREEEMR